MVLFRVISCAALLVTLSACGDETVDGVAQRSESDGVSCAGDVVVTEPTGEVRVPASLDALAAAEAWVGPHDGEIVVHEDDKHAYLLREDGSPRARIDVHETRVDLEDDQPSSWYVDGSAVCADEVTTEPWLVGDLLDCDGEVGYAQVSYDAVRDRRLQSAELPFELYDARRDELKLTLTTGSASGDATVVVSAKKGAQTVYRLLRDSDTWHVSEVAACPSVMPGLDAAGPDPLVNLFVGHCWVAPLEHDGRAWELPDTDQFGGGGGGPGEFRAIGSATVTGDALVYVDLSGTRLDLVPADAPGTEANHDMCA